MANPRRLLREQLKLAWKRTIRDAYDQQLINSERGLQAYFCSQLMAIFKRRKLPRRLFIEPAVEFDNGILRWPDLLICNSGKVIGAIEFKYTPCKKAAVKKDLETLQSFKKQSQSVTVYNDRYRGLVEKKKYSIAEDAVLCWAAVHAEDVCPLSKVAQLKADLGLLCLEARTKDKASPAVFIDGVSVKYGKKGGP